MRVVSSKFKKNLVHLMPISGNSPAEKHGTINGKKLSELPATSKESDAMSKDLIKRGFKFAGSTICYSYMQAAGIINDHLVHCYRHMELKNEITHLP